MIVYPNKCSDQARTAQGNRYSLRTEKTYAVGVSGVQKTRFFEALSGWLAAVVPMALGVDQGLKVRSGGGCRAAGRKRVFGNGRYLETRLARLRCRAAVVSLLIFFPI